MGSHSRAVIRTVWILLRQCMMSRLAPILLLLSLAFLVHISGSPSPGHMQHKYYQDQERERVRQRASRKADWEEFHHSGAHGMEEASWLVVAGMLVLAQGLGL